MQFIKSVMFPHGPGQHVESCCGVSDCRWGLDPQYWPSTISCYLCNPLRTSPLAPEYEAQRDKRCCQYGSIIHSTVQYTAWRVSTWLEYIKAFSASFWARTALYCISLFAKNSVLISMNLLQEKRWYPLFYFGAHYWSLSGRTDGRCFFTLNARILNKKHHIDCCQINVIKFFFCH